MDEQRLNRIESTLGIRLGVGVATARELIAALREAWKEVERLEQRIRDMEEAEADQRYRGRIDGEG